MSRSWVGSFLVLVGIAWSGTMALASPPLSDGYVQWTTGEERVLLDNGNKLAVLNGAHAPTQFTLRQDCMITYVDTYHWNYGRGRTPGTIGLRHSDGTLYGPWQATGLPGQGGVPNALWVVRPHVRVKAGTLTVVDSDPASWAQNSQSLGRGFSQVKGIFHDGVGKDLLVVVPSLIGISHQLAHARLQSVGLTLQHPGEPPLNTLVKSQNPLAGTRVRRGSTVSVTFSQAVTVPNLAGVPHDVAEQRIAALGLVLKHGGTPSPTAKIVFQNPPPGTQVNQGSAVTVVFQERVTVPNLARLDHARTHQQVESLGLTLVHGAEPGAGELVKSQNPAAGTEVAPGSQVQVVFAPLSEIIADELAKVDAKSGDVQISLLWTNRSDLDLHVVCPSGETIWYSHRNSKCGGELDIDRNAQYATSTANAVENVYWPKGKAPAGKYKVYVDFYSNHGNQPGCQDPSAFDVRIQVQGKIQVFHGVVGSKTTRKVLVHEFTLSADSGATTTKVTLVPPQQGPLPQTNFGYRGNVVIQGNVVPELGAELRFTIKGNVLTGTLEAPPICEPNRRLFGAAIALTATLPVGTQWEGPGPITGTITGDIVGCPGRTPISQGNVFILTMKGKTITLTTTGLYYNTYQFGTPMGQVFTVRSAGGATGDKALGTLIPFSNVSKEIQQAFSPVSEKELTQSSGVVIIGVGQTFSYKPYQAGLSPFVIRVVERGPLSLLGNPGVASVRVTADGNVELTGKLPGYGRLRFNQPIKVEIPAENFQTTTEWRYPEGNVFVVVKSPLPPPPKEKTLPKVAIRGRAIRRDNNQPVVGAFVQLVSNRGKGAKYPPPLVLEGAPEGFLGIDQSDKWQTDAKGEFTIVAENMIPEGEFEIFLIRFNKDPSQKLSYEQDLWPVKTYLLNLTKEAAERGPFDVGTIVMDSVENLWGSEDQSKKKPGGTGRQGIEWRGGGPPGSGWLLPERGNWAMQEWRWDAAFAADDRGIARPKRGRDRAE